MSRFTLEGVAFWQEYRKQRGKVYGPFWHSKGPDGRVRYVGRNLPPEIERARAQRDAYAGARLNWLRRNQHRQADSLLAKIAAIDRLRTGERLSEQARAWLVEMDLGDALVDDEQLPHNNTAGGV